MKKHIIVVTCQYFADIIDLIKEMWIVFWYELPTLRNCALQLAVCVIGLVIGAYLVAKDNNKI